MISVILPTYNEARSIKRIIPAITELFREKAIDGEIIVVDDDSPDGTAGVAFGAHRLLPPGHGPGEEKRRIVSRGAGLLARGVTSLFDPTSGFIAVRKSILYAGMGVKPWYILASFIGIAAATGFDFLGSRYVAFAIRN